AFAQELRGRIAGIVTDESGAIVPGVTVTASSPALIQPQTTTTGGDGTYRFPALPSGIYSITYSLQGFQTVKRDGIRVTLNQTFSVDARLKPASLTETMTITADAPTVDTTTTSIGTAFTKELLTDIPNARDVWAAMSQAPGFQMQAFDVGGSHTGTQTGYLTYGVGDQNKTMIEGINVTESTNANAGYFDFGSFEEFQAGGAGNLGEQSGPGALMNITIKSGGDKFGGQIYYDYEGTSTIADNVPNAFKTPGGVGDGGFKAPTVTDPATKALLGLQRGNPITKQYDFNASIGGPIIKGKLWFFASFRNNNQFKTILGLPGEEAQSQLKNYTGKLTYQLNPKNQIILFANQRTKLQPLRDLSLTTPVESAYYQASKNRPMKIEWTSVLSDKAFLDLQVSHWLNAFPLYPTKTQSSDTTGVPVGRLDLSTGQLSGANNAYQDQFRYKPQISGSFSYFVDNFGPGNHNFKVGFEWLRDRKEFLSFQPGDIYYRDARVTGGTITTQEVDVWNTPSNSINDSVQSAAFLNDTWALSSRLSLNLALRYDRYALGWPDQNATPNQSAFFQPITASASTLVTLQSLSPRIGFAWDITGKGRTVLKGFFGKYAYNPSADVTDRENPVGAATRRYAFVACSATVTTGCDLNGNKLVDSPAELGRLISTAGGAGSVKVDRNLDHPYGLEISTHLEHELVPGLSLRGSYVFKGTRNEWAEVDTVRASALNVPFNFLDPGPDGLTGTADDQTVQLFGMPAGTGSNRVYGNPEKYGLPGFEADYHTVEFAVNRRLKDKWMLLTSFEHTWANSFANPAQASTSALGIIRHSTTYLWNPTQRRFGRQDQTFWNFKMIGRYELPWQLALAGSFKLQSGANWARYTSVTIPNLGATNVAMEPLNSNRSPNVGILDLRAEKAFKIKGSRKITGMVDVFNALNSATVVNFRVVSPAANTTNATSNRFKELIALLDPRIIRFGVRLDF
ncbi:MAG: TonB-dependent receptor, partial [Vicinamibacteria bacterium]